jgi:hypothetical protein
MSYVYLSSSERIAAAVALEAFGFPSDISLINRLRAAGAVDVQLSTHVLDNPLIVHSGLLEALHGLEKSVADGGVCGMSDLKELVLAVMNALDLLDSGLLD